MQTGSRYRFDESARYRNPGGMERRMTEKRSRVVLIPCDTYEEDTPIVKLINPKILKQKGSREVEEGCLSFPNKFAKVIRPTEVVVEGLNENGEKVKIKAVELLAQALCHEIDHLNGITFVDIMEPGTLEYVEPQN